MTGTLHASVVGVALALLMLAIAVSDWRSYRVPDRLTGLALTLRGVDLLAGPSASFGSELLHSLFRAATMAGLFYLFREVYRRLRGREGMGLGDVKLAAVAGAWVDWPLLPAVVEAASIIGLALALLRAVRSGQRLSFGVRMPFAVGFSVAIFVGWQMQRLYF